MNRPGDVMAAIVREAQAKGREERELRKLSFKVINAGHKALVARGGSAEDMARLDRVRSLLKKGVRHGA